MKIAWRAAGLALVSSRSSLPWRVSTAVRDKSTRTNARHLDRHGPRSGRHAGRERLGVGERRDRQGRRRSTSATSATTSRRSPPRTHPTSSSARTTGPASSRPTASCCRSTRARRRRRSSRSTRSTRSRTAPRSRSSTASRSQLENIGALVNTKLAKVPTTFAQLEKRGARRSRRRSAGNLGIAVQQGSGGDAYHMYPFFSGLGGYVFGTNKAGNLDPSDIGVANTMFLKNAQLIDKWNKEGLINSKIDYSTRKNAFLKGKAAFWITGPWESDTLKKSGRQVQDRPGADDRVAVGAVPRRPGLHGHEVRRRRTASRRSRKDLVANYMLDAGGAAAARRRRTAARRRTSGRQGVTRSGPRAVRQGRRGRRADAEHPADGERLDRPRPGVGQVDEGRRRDAGRGAPSRRAARAIATKIG